MIPRLDLSSGPGRRRVLVAVGLVVIAVGGVAVARRGSGADEDTGAAAGWTWHAPGDSRGLATDGRVVCSAATIDLYCVDAATGEERFTRRLDWAIESAPVLVDDRLMVGNEGRLAAYSLDGEELWSTRVDSSPQRAVPVAGGVAVLAGITGLRGVDVATGAERWRAYPYRQIEDPVVARDAVFTDGARVYSGLEAGEPGERTDHVVAVDPASGAELWRSPALPGGGRSDLSAAAPLANGSGVAFLVDAAEPDEPLVVVLDAATGAVRWEAPLSHPDASLAHLDGTTVVADGAEMRGYDGNGRQLWAVPAPLADASSDGDDAGELVVDHGRLFVVGEDVLEVDPADGTSRIVQADADAADIVVAGDLLVMDVGADELAAVPLPPPDGT